MIASLSLILLCQLAGEALARGIGLPMLLLLLLPLRDRFVVLARGPAAKATQRARDVASGATGCYLPAAVASIQGPSEACSGREATS
jgi:holin-like protein